MKVKTALILDTRRALSDGKYPIKLRLTFNRRQRYYTTHFSASRDEFEKYMGRNPKGLHKQIRMALDAIEQKANEVINELRIFDFSLFERKFNRDSQLQEDVYSYYEKIISDYEKNGQIGTASNYRCSKNSLKLFKPNLSFFEITPEFLMSYEKHVLKKGKSITTVGIYLRPLKSVINRVIADEILPKDYSQPFGSKSKLKYQIPTSKNTKKALSAQEIKLLFEYDTTEVGWKSKALDFWKFSYLANGMNMKDISLLKYGDIKGDFIEFVRAKTINTNRTVSPIKVYLTDHIKEIIEKYGQKNKSPNCLIFTIINMKDDLKKQRADLQQFIKMVNKYMRAITEELSIEKDCTTYTARHSTATILKRSGADIQMISEALGHSSISTTRAYLDSFEDESKKEMAKLLVKFD
jgi:integrase/recombinase XerD